MIPPTRIAGLLIGAWLSASLPGAGLAQTLAGSPPASAASAAGPVRSPAVAETRSLRIAQATAPDLVPPAPMPPVTVPPRGRVYLFRGALGPIFSRGMDRLTDRLQQAGFTADVYEFTICRWIAEGAIRDYRADPAPIILIGHSMGGYCDIKFAEMLQDENIPVSLIVTIDPAHITPTVPLNVERFINIFLSKDVLGGGDVKPSKGYQGHYASYDLSLHDEVSHITIDKMDDVHRQLVEKILQLSTTPAKTDEAPLGLRYVVPPKVPIELWDSGMPVAARAGDTLLSIARSYHLPIWALSQVNKGPVSAALVPGEQITVPRHLLPVADVARPQPDAEAVPAAPADRSTSVIAVQPLPSAAGRAVSRQ